MKKYIIITYDIHPVGGTQAYTAGKARYLEKCGWNVIVLFAGNNNEKCDIAYLNKFLFGGNMGLGLLPYDLQEKVCDYIVDGILTDIGIEGKEDLNIIESHYDVAAFWGELLAEKLKCKHYIFCCNEYYRNKNGYKTYYKENLDFFYFKYCRNELIASREATKRLFKGYKGVIDRLIEYPEFIVEQDPVQDVLFENVDLLPRSKWNICIISRMDKPFVRKALLGVKNFARLHPSYDINLIFIGDENPIREYINDIFYGADNVKIIFWGVLVPIPRIIFKKIDVIIAVAQTARLISYEGVCVITANVLTTKASGVLGYDTQDSWYGSEVKGKTYENFLEDVLISDKYNNKSFNMPEHRPAEHYYEKQWDYLNYSSLKEEYYTERLKKYRHKNWMAIFPFWRVNPNEKVIIYGAGKIGDDYISQIEASSYCELVAVIDGRHEDFDMTVLSPDIGLKDKEFNTVIIAVKSNDCAEQMIARVKELTVGKKIIHDIKICST
ncbi:hypothetical protein D081_1059 [Anaerovibrio sp. JC8]|uniref:hypothetical protein n=1 Tax=Anaerovibrio sp. JC8 TaxID=1240085 RepID=UPI000A0B25E4|nr:hypothetical protein [Anaerovibrio sp. JC8]ORU00536.1 hypothetical protein D081_1059 [Anaerovibrio sp. JC8]